MDVKAEVPPPFLFFAYFNPILPMEIFKEEILVLVQRKKEVQRPEMREAHIWRGRMKMIGTDSLEVSNFQLCCTTWLCFFLLQDAESIPAAFLLEPFISFPRMGLPPSCSPAEHRELFIQNNKLCSILSSRL